MAIQPEEKKSYSAVIPVKKNSSRLPGKNILPFGESNLLINKINQLKGIDGIEEIIVSSDSDEMLNMAIKEGVKVDKRPDYLADESRPLSDFFDYIVKKINSEYMLWACCTSPLFARENFSDCIDIWNKIDETKYDSLITVYKWKHYILNEDGPMNYKLGKSHQNSQDLPTYDLFTNGCLIASKHNVKKWSYNYGPNAFRYEVSQSESIDIDTPEDYQIAVALYNFSQKSQ